MSKKFWRMVVIALFAFATTLALGLDFSSELPDIWISMQREGSLMAIVNNMLIGLHHFHTMDHINGTLIAVLCVIIYSRYLFCKRFSCGRGEYVLGAFFTVAMLISEAMTAQETIACLADGGMQLLKTALFTAGMFPLCLSGVRALREGLVRLENTPVHPYVKRWWTRHSFGISFLILMLCWLPYIYMKFPIGMSPDATVQIFNVRDGEIAKNHPVFSTVVYGFFWKLGNWMQNPNLSYFFLTVIQTLTMAGVLAYSISCMQRWKVPFAVRAASLLLYAIVPNYSGWITIMVKDVPYLIGCLLLNLLLIDFSLDKHGFFKKRKNWLLMIMAMVTVWLWRRNGLALVIVCAAYMLLTSRFAKSAIAVALIGCMLGFGIQLTVEKATNAGPAGDRETYAQLLQATGRIVRLHGDELPQDELDVIARVLDYEKAAREYSPIITDSVKFNFIEGAGTENYHAYARVAIRQMLRYPLDALDSYLNLTYRIFDWRSDRTVHMDRREVEHPYYIRSYTNELYDHEALRNLDAAQEAVENWNFWYPDLPVIGLFVNIGFCSTVLLTMTYFFWKKKVPLAALFPSLITVGFLMLSSIVYIRYALPLTASLPFWFAAYFAKREEKTL